MSLVLQHFDMILEITEGGDLLFPKHDLAYDIAFAAMGGHKSPEMAFLEDWENNPTTVFFAFGLNTLNQAEMLLVGRAIVDTIVLLSGVSDIHGTNFENIGQEIYEAGARAITLVSGDSIEDLRDRMGWVGAALQQQRWRMSGSGMTWYFDPRLDPSRSVVDAATQYIRLVDALHGVNEYWERLGRKKAIPLVDQMARGPLAELTSSHKQHQAETWQPGELPVPIAFVPDAKKIIVGAIVGAIDGESAR